MTYPESRMGSKGKLVSSPAATTSPAAPAVRKQFLPNEPNPKFGQLAQPSRMAQARYFVPEIGYPCQTYSKASGSVCLFTAPSVCPALRAKTN